MSAYVLYSMLALIGVLGLWFHLLPRLARHEIYFAVTVDGAFRDSDEAVRILGIYRLQVWLHTLVSGALVVAASAAGVRAFLAAAVLWQTAGFVAAFLIARRRVVPHAVAPEARREAELAPRRAAWPGGWIAQLGPFLVLAVAGGLLYARWDVLPERFPVHWGIDGAPDRWVEKTAPEVYGGLVTGLAISVLCAAIGQGILRYSRRIHSAGGGEGAFQRTVLWMVLGAEYFVALASGSRALLPLASSERVPAVLPFLPLVLMPVLLLVLLLAFLRVGQGGSRLDGQAAGRRPVGDRTRDACWRWGLVYVNREDPAVFVEKRIGIGYTLNFGNSWSWIALAALVAVPVLIVLLRAA